MSSSSGSVQTITMAPSGHGTYGRIETCATVAVSIGGSAMTETLPESLVSGAGSDAVPYAQLDGGSADPLCERRSFERLSAPSARPVRLHFQASHLAP